jgi:phosphate:Na+ symporter
MRGKYQEFRRMIAKMIRAVNRTKENDDQVMKKKEIADLKKFFKVKLKSANKKIDKLIRDNLIDVNMASSLVNDHDTVDDMITTMLEVCELLYLDEDSLLEPTEFAPDHVHHSTD